MPPTASSRVGSIASTKVFSACRFSQRRSRCRPERGCLSSSRKDGRSARPCRLQRAADLRILLLSSAVSSAAPLQRRRQSRLAQQTITHVLSDNAIQVAHNVGETSVICSNNRPLILRIDPARGMQWSRPGHRTSLSRDDVQLAMARRFPRS